MVKSKATLKYPSPNEGIRSRLWSRIQSDDNGPAFEKYRGAVRWTQQALLGQDSPDVGRATSWKNSIPPHEAFFTQRYQARQSFDGKRRKVAHYVHRWHGPCQKVHERWYFHDFIQENTFRTRMENSSQGLPAMHRFQPTWVFNNPAVMISNQSVTCWCIFCGAFFHGRTWRHQRQNKSTRWSWKKNCRRRWISCARITFPKCRHLSVTRETWNSSSHRITTTWREFWLEHVRGWGSSSIISTIGAIDFFIIFPWVVGYLLLSKCSKINLIYIKFDQFKYNIDGNKSSTIWSLLLSVGINFGLDGLD